jgi:hypothetical protein
MPRFELPFFDVLELAAALLWLSSVVPTCERIAQTLSIGAGLISSMQSALLSALFIAYLTFLSVSGTL